jgi:hypothetical protein
MRKITIWLTATLAVVAMATYYQVSVSGDQGKDESPAAQAEHTGKPGESKGD